MPKPRRSKDDYLGRATDSVGRIFESSRKRFMKEWNPSDPIGPDPDTVADWRRRGLPLDPGYGPIVSPFTNIAFRAVPSALDFGVRGLSSAFHGGISAVGQTAREFGASDSGTRRLERDVRAVPETLAGLGSPWSRGPKAFNQFSDRLGEFGRTSTAARTTKPGGAPVSPVAPAPGTALVPLHHLERISRLKGNPNYPGNNRPGPYVGPDFIATRSGTSVHASQQELKNSITAAGAKHIKPTRGPQEFGDIYRLKTRTGAMDIRIMPGKTGAAPNSFFGPRTINTESGHDKIYVYPNGDMIKGRKSKSQRREIGHIHGQRRN